MTITSYFGLKPCCDCGRTGNYTVSKNGYQFTVCSDCVHNYSDEECEIETSKAIIEMRKRIAELEAQIEKMKNCKNCKELKKEKDGLLFCTVGSFYTNIFGKNCDKWEMTND